MQIHNDVKDAKLEKKTMRRHQRMHVPSGLVSSRRSFIYKNVSMHVYASCSLLKTETQSLGTRVRIRNARIRWSRKTPRAWFTLAQGMGTVYKLGHHSDNSPQNGSSVIFGVFSVSFFVIDFLDPIKHSLFTVAAN